MQRPAHLKGTGGTERPSGQGPGVKTHATARYQGFAGRLKTLLRPD